MPSASANYPNLHVVDHPLVADKMTYLRDKTTGRRAFRALVEQIAGLMVYEATRTLDTSLAPVETPLETTQGLRLTVVPTVVPILRAGLGMAAGVLDMLPTARVGHIGLARNEETLKPRKYLATLPDGLGSGPVLLLDPMLATGGSAAAATSLLKEHEANDIRLLCLVSAPTGVQRMLDDHPDVPIFTAALDQGLDERGYIRAGRGAAGDRIFGTGAWTDTTPEPP
jgi:uracil phosphoribosyltransferase